MTKYIAAIHSFLKNSLFLYTLIFVGILLKIAFLFAPTATNGDYETFLFPWVEYIKTHGYLKAFNAEFYNYTPLYIYVLLLIAKLGLNPLFAIKLFSVLFEYLTAVFIGKIVVLKSNTTKSTLYSLAFLPLIPSVFINSSYWAQCDSVYAFFIVASIYYILVKKEFLSVLFLGIAFSLKLQTMFISPLFFLFLLRKEIRWYYFLLIPAVYILTILPAFIQGRSMDSLLNIYLNQSKQYEYLTLQFPNLYSWISNDYYKLAKMIGLLSTAGICLASCVYLSAKKIQFTTETTILFSLVCAVIVPFILPGMHERYLYLGDVLGLLYILMYQKNYFVGIGIWVISIYSYACCTRLHDVLPVWPAFLLYLAVIVLLMKEFIFHLKKNTKQ